MQTSDWYGSYRKSWAIAPLSTESYAHPGKVAFGLAERIHEHLLAQGYLRPGDTAVDPFAGVGGFAYHAIRSGVNFIGVELEHHFHVMAQGMDCPGFDKVFWRRYQGRGKRWPEIGVCPECAAVLDAGCKELPLLHWFGRVSREIPARRPHRYCGNVERWEGPGAAVILHGDSRRLTELVGQVGAAITSPPYGVDTLNDRNGIDTSKIAGRPGGKNSQARAMAGYGHTAGQLSVMPRGSLDAAISSPPYQNGGVHHKGREVDEREMQNWRTDKSSTKGNIGKSQVTGYGNTAGQLANMTPGQLDAAISSPPYGNVLSGKGEGPGARHDPVYHNGDNAYKKTSLTQYGDTAGNLGQSEGETFWTAARAILEQVYAVLKPGGVAVFVTGNFRRNGQIVDFGAQWLQLCTAVGFRPVEHIRAWKHEPGPVQLSVVGEAVDMTVIRESFFRRLDNRKYPGEEILHEDVFIVEKPCE